MTKERKRREAEAARVRKEAWYQKEKDTDYIFIETGSVDSLECWLLAWVEAGDWEEDKDPFVDFIDNGLLSPKVSKKQH